MLVFAVDHALRVTLVSLAIWVVLFPVLVQGLIIYAIVQAKGEKRENDAFRHRSSVGSNQS